MEAEEVVKQTKQHIKNVQMFLNHISVELMKRGRAHDKSKFKEPEFETFKIYTEKLATSTYGSEEYKTFLKEMKPALDHHYSHNSHHPEHNPNGIDGMNILDLVEMLCDWKAASMRHNDGDITKSIEYNSKRFNMSEQLKNIFINSIPLLENKDKK
jgi:hypothetical protein